MPISELTDEQRNQLIEIMPVVYKGTTNTIGRVLRKIRDGEKIDDNDKELIEKWDVAPKEGGGYKAGMCLTHIVIQHFKKHGKFKP